VGGRALPPAEALDGAVQPPRLGTFHRLDERVQPLDLGVERVQRLLALAGGQAVALDLGLQLAALAR
jgi:hypothetical protein